MARVYAVYTVVDELNKQLKSSNDVKFYVSERRSSLSHLENIGIIDYARIDTHHRLHVYLIKNFDDLPENKWREAVANLGKTLQSKMAGKDVNTRYSWSKGKYLDITELSADIASSWGDTPNTAPSAMRIAFDKVDTANVNALYDLKDADDPQIEVNGAKAANFIRYIKSGPTVVLPRQLWRNMGWSQIAIDSNIQVKSPEIGSDIVAILKDQFEVVVGKNGFTVTTDEAPLLSKPRENYDGPEKSLIPKSVSRLFGDIGRVVDNSTDMLDMKKRYSDTKDASEKTKINKLMNDFYKAKFNELLKSDFYQDYLNALDSVKGYSPEIDYKTMWYQSEVKNNLDIMDSKLIQIKKHPKYDYFIIVNVAGTKIPQY